MTLRRIAVLVPCFNEEQAIGRVVADFRRALPEALIYCCDNNSTDRTAELARAAGARVLHEGRQGKGEALRRMFADIEADLYLLVDGDGTYDSAAAPAMVARLLSDNLDMVVASRRAVGRAAYRPGHRFGNRLLTGVVRTIFGRQIADMLSGYRVLSRRFVKSFPALSKGFEIETEITIHALELRLPIAEMEAPYFERAPGSVSKLRTVADGLRIVWTIQRMLREERPLAFYSAVAATLALLSLGVGLPVVLEFLATGLVPRLPSAVLAASLMLLAALAFASALILDTVSQGRREFKRLAYLAIPGPAGAASDRGQDGTGPGGPREQQEGGTVP